LVRAASHSLQRWASWRVFKAAHPNFPPRSPSWSMLRESSSVLSRPIGTGCAHS
jgi:hypothetical protein